MFQKAVERYAALPVWQKVLIVGAGAPIGILGGIACAPAVGAVISAAGFGILGGMLSGAAASSAGLAALGGGAMLAGGTGIAGGTVIIVATTAAATTSSLAIADHVVSKNGRRSAQEATEARAKKVTDDDVRFET